jgi:hypothetical protein
MSGKLQRIEKAEARLRRPKSEAPIMILCDRPEDVQRRIDVLIAVGNLTEADRPRCVFWEDPGSLDGMTHDEWVLMMDKNETADDRRRQWEESAARARAEAIAAFADYPGKSPYAP